MSLFRSLIFANRDRIFIPLKLNLSYNKNKQKETPFMSPPSPTQVPQVSQCKNSPPNSKQTLSVCFWVLHSFSVLLCFCSVCLLRIARAQNVFSTPPTTFTALLLFLLYKQTDSQRVFFITIPNLIIISKKCQYSTIENPQLLGNYCCDTPQANRINHHLRFVVYPHILTPELLSSLSSLSSLLLLYSSAARATPIPKRHIFILVLMGMVE